MFLKEKFHLSMSDIGNILAVNSICSVSASMFSGILLSKFFYHKEKNFILISSIILSILCLGFGVSTDLNFAVFCLFCSTILSYFIFTSIYLLGHIK